MHSTKLTFALLFFATALIAGCGSTPSTPPQSAAAGNWNWSLDTPQGVYTGQVMLTGTDETLAGFITNDAAEGQSPLTEVSFVENQLKFAFDSGEYGIMNIDVMVDGDAFSGELFSDFGSMPFTGQRADEEATQ